MKWIVYHRQIPDETDTLPNGEIIVTSEAYLQEEKLAFTDSNKEIQIAEALKYAYNGEVTIEDDGQPEPEPSTEEVLLEIAADHEERLCMMELGI